MASVADTELMPANWHEVQIAFGQWSLNAFKASWHRIGASTSYKRARAYARELEGELDVYTRGALCLPEMDRLRAQGLVTRAFERDCRRSLAASAERLAAMWPPWQTTDSFRAGGYQYAIRIAGMRHHLKTGRITATGSKEVARSEDK